MSAFHDEVWESLPDDLHPPLLERRRAFLLARVSARERVLDLGCGEGDFTAALADAGADPLGADVSERALERARAGDLVALARGRVRQRRYAEARAALREAATLAPPTPRERALAATLSLPGLRAVLGRRPPYPTASAR